MSIVSLFCEIHDFFMLYETHLSTHCLPHLKNADVGDVYTPAK